MTRRTAVLSTITGLAFTAAASQLQSAEESAPANPELEKVRALLKAHDDALTNHNLDAVLATYAANGALMGTGPGEMWGGHQELAEAYKHFFEGFDKGAQDFTYQHRLGGLTTDMGWLMASGNVTGKKDGKPISFPLNVSVTVGKEGGTWKIVSMHFSTLTGLEGAEAKQS